ncbi:IS3 family transposase [Stenotrophomonas rhizophila]|uniref:IS3 family transposase n=1 Tax=Stenotrophomonas rhizophila TaxID=216778 RepID=UPI002A6A24A8|nr:IS3 family transposase [Stenotrophomonas rhizophila]MDY0955553.1 IS3 family transposase [Stenotrophomonas rhizophila]
MIQELGKAAPIRLVCQLMDYPRSSYYAWLRREPQIDQALLDQVDLVRRIHKSHRGSCGSRRMARELTNNGLHVGRYRARTLMRRAGVRARQHRRHKYHSLGPQALTVPNVLDRQFNPEAPNQVWAGDITYIPTQQGWLYLAVVVDLYARRIVGWAHSHEADAWLAVRALRGALKQRLPQSGMLFHSDQGRQYTSHAMAEILRDNGITQSMSRKGNCWDNAVVERVFATLKGEWLYAKYPTRQEAAADIEQFVDWYNNRRLHTANGLVPPALHEAQVA